MSHPRPPWTGMLFAAGDHWGSVPCWDNVWGADGLKAVLTTYGIYRNLHINVKKSHCGREHHSLGLPVLIIVPYRIIWGSDEAGWCSRRITTNIWCLKTHSQSSGLNPDILKTWPYGPLIRTLSSSVRNSWSKFLLKKHFFEVVAAKSDLTMNIFN